MAFDPTPYLVKVKGGQLYLPVKDRLIWLREEHPDAAIATEMVHLDLELQLAIFRAQVTVPNRGSATGYGSETERDFPAGWVEKAETKAIGRALAALGFGTQFALELDEGERVVDTPVTPLPRRSERASLKVVADDRAARLREQVTAGLASDKEASAKLPKTADDMTVDELEKTLAWLRNRQQRQA
jgi:hypothetical protein